MPLLDLFKRKRKEPKGATDNVLMSLQTMFPRWLRTDYTLQNSELIFSAVSRIANTFSTMPLQLYKGSKPVKNDVNDLVANSPNSFMTASTFFKTLEACRDTEGNCYALKIVDKNMKVQRLDVLDPTRVTPLLERESQELWYRVVPEEGSEFYIHNFYMIHIPFISTNGYIGVNPVKVLLNTLKYADDVQKFSVSQLEKGVNATVVLEAPATLGDAQKAKMLDAFITSYKQSGGNVMLLESGVTAKPLNLSPIDTKIFEVEKLSRGKVAMVYNMPPHLLGDYSDTSFATMEQQMLEFLSLTLLPIVTAYEQELNKKLLTQAERKVGYRFKFSMDAILRADSQTMANVHQMAIRGGWMTPNEVRTEKGLSPKPEANKLMASRDLIALEYIVNNPAEMMGAKGVEGNGQVDENEGT